MREAGPDAAEVDLRGRMFGVVAGSVVWREFAWDYGVGEGFGCFLDLL